MTLPIHRAWRRRIITMLAIVALLFTAGVSPASANVEVPQDITTDEFKEFCDLAGGRWIDMGSGRATCFFDGWYMDCDGTTCYIFCYRIACIEERNASSTLRQASRSDDQKVVDEPTPQPRPRGRGRSTPVDQPQVVAPDSTAVPEPSIGEKPATEPGVVVIDPA